MHVSSLSLFLSLIVVIEWMRVSIVVMLLVHVITMWWDILCIVCMLLFIRWVWLSTLSHSLFPSVSLSFSRSFFLFYSIFILMILLLDLSPPTLYRIPYNKCIFIHFSVVYSRCETLKLIILNNIYIYFYWEFGRVGSKKAKFKVKKIFFTKW